MKIKILIRIFKIITKKIEANMSFIIILDYLKKVLKTGFL